MEDRPGGGAGRIRIAIRAYGSLNDFLPPSRRWRTTWHEVAGHPAVKDFVESLGIPHPEVDLLLANGTSIPFGYALQDGDRIAAYPRFETLDVSAASHVRPPPMAEPRFVADGHLGRLARLLRLLGLDTVYDTAADDEALALTASRDDRALLTRDVGLLKRRAVVHGYFVRNTGARQQMLEVIRRYKPLPLRPFSRCLACNTPLREASSAEVQERLPPRTREHFERFQVCDACGRVYWQGSHWIELSAFVDEATREAGPP